MKKLLPLLTILLGLTSAIEHQVIYGETLLSIANQYKTTPAKLRQLNGLTSNTIEIGQTLILPTTKSPLTPAATQASTASPVVTTPVVKTRTVAPTPAPQPVKVAPRPIAPPAPTPVVAPAANPQVNETAQQYTIRSGDTLYSVSRRYGVSTAQLIEWNQISNPNNIPVGTQLKLYGGRTIQAPAATQRTTYAPATASATARTAPIANQSNVRTHRVASGETIYRIAKNYGIRQSDLISWNGITDPSKLAVGQVLYLYSDASNVPAQTPASTYNSQAHQPAIEDYSSSEPVREFGYEETSKNYRERFNSNTSGGVQPLRKKEIHGPRGKSKIFRNPKK